MACQDAAFICPFVASLEKESAWGIFYYFGCPKTSPAILLILGFDKDCLAVMHH